MLGDEDEWQPLSFAETLKTRLAHYHDRSAIIDSSIVIAGVAARCFLETPLIVETPQNRDKHTPQWRKNVAGSSGMERPRRLVIQIITQDGCSGRSWSNRSILEARASTPPSEFDRGSS